MLNPRLMTCALRLDKTIEVEVTMFDHAISAIEHYGWISGAFGNSYSGVCAMGAYRLGVRGTVNAPALRREKIAEGTFVGYMMLAIDDLYGKQLKTLHPSWGYDTARVIDLLRTEPHVLQPLMNEVTNFNDMYACELNRYDRKGIVLRVMQRARELYLKDRHEPTPAVPLARSEVDLAAGPSK